MHSTEPTRAGAARPQTLSSETVATFSVGFGKQNWLPALDSSQSSAVAARRELGYPRS
ncbi:hypothetical protein ACFQJ5_12650 [Halomicroarcula sp. GCM10025324]|uniref:hypothetical protein n=1 Tax=Haloarcula TaxID=2237 RepID=UPI0023E7C215|nr:hypothetical protein [Halomicroarcula sp. ZS-22-S1]